MEGLCGKCQKQLIGGARELEMSFRAALVCRDGRRWFAFSVDWHGPTDMRKLTLIRSCDRETEAESAAFEAVKRLGNYQEPTPVEVSL